MKNIKFAVMLLLGFTACKDKTEKTDALITEKDTATEVSETRDISEELSNSPRHHEWVTLSHGDRSFQAFVAYPEKSEKTKSIIVIHENRGLNDWARIFTDKLAKEGYLVIAPDLISNTQDGKERTTDFENSDKAREAIYALNPDQVTADLDAAFEYIKNDAASTGEVAVVGFCWGGSQTFRYATHNEEITSANVFYGTAPEDDSALKKINTPVFGYYGGNDARVNASIEETDKMMKEFGKTYEYEIYENAGHAFMRNGHENENDKPNKAAHDKAWERLLSKL